MGPVYFARLADDTHDQRVTGTGHGNQQLRKEELTVLCNVVRRYARSRGRREGAEADVRQNHNLEFETPCLDGRCQL